MKTEFQLSTGTAIVFFCNRAKNLPDYFFINESPGAEAGMQILSTTSIQIVKDLSGGE